VKAETAGRWDSPASPRPQWCSLLVPASLVYVGVGLALIARWIDPGYVRR
jgi:hypothetical protein